ncbi:efflux RND transporter periplasmic adaptor subunit [Porphyromonas levii]|uniref:efflux RND transporter periplasmic adaptor subunit n=1 Tax=Porphyromonas levii TaxID=28114 RepID=UPI001B8ADC7D|nr:efflux RND transporter periplasmic adaptor subunit [Porphyromonas levii]MBR8770022.1 putative efflux system component YknX [Porphyromonas levii]MBR8802840.1 putative efflux system component YknX [Porphyromonas levii]MBR8806963.1 putative efflux system component YknX [Porphyromonas levii]
MKRITYIVASILIVALVVLILILNKRSTASKTQMLEDEASAVAVRTEVVDSSSYATNFETNGVLEAAHDLSFVSDMGGRVMQIYANEGDQVQKGKVLIQLDAETLRADVESTRVAYEAAQKDYERFKNANAQGGVTDQQLAAIHTQMVAAESRYIASRRRLSDASIKAPMSGKIYKRYVEVGSFLNPGAKLFDIIDDSQLKVNGYLTEKQRLGVTKGQAVVVTSDLYPGKTIAGEVTFVSDKADRSLNFPVEVTITEKERDLLPGMYVGISFGNEAQKTGILIPRSAISGSVKDASVYVVQNGVATKKPIVAGGIIGNRIEVLEGLQQGDSIVIAGLINITNGTPVKNVK